MLASNSDDKNLYKALARGVDSMRTQIIRKSDKLKAS
jgi:ribosome-associated translation inhibitor RaiA